MNHDLPGYTFLQDMLERQLPDLWKLCYPRVYENLGKWHSPKIPATVFGQAIVGHAYARRRHQDMATAGTLNQYTVAQLCLEHRIPTYFIPTAVLHALEQTAPPPDLKWTELHLPHPGCVFMFEHGAVRHPREGEIAYFAYGRMRSNCRFVNQMDPSITDNVPAQGGGIIFSTATHQFQGMPLYDLSMSEKVSESLGDIAKAADRYARNVTIKDGLSMEIPITPEDSTFNKWMAATVFKIILLMLARPEVIAHGQKVNEVRNKKTGKTTEFWAPTIIGRHWRPERQEPEGTHASPRMHWRRGHFRQQPHGPNRSQVKTVWIEPMIVAAPSEEKPAGSS